MLLTNNVIEVIDITYSYGGAPALEDVSLTVREGQSLGVIGPNGGGKTTLLKLILGLLVPDKGRIRVFGQPPLRVARKIGYVPQYAGFDRTFPITAWEVVLMGRLGLGRLLGNYRREDKQVAQVAMERVGVWQLKNRRLGSLSEGQQQRVLLARALTSEPQLLVLDEPTASVDQAAEQEIAHILRELRGDKTIVMVSHDLDLLDHCVDHLVQVNRHAGALQTAVHGR